MSGTIDIFALTKMNIGEYIHDGEYIPFDLNMFFEKLKTDAPYSTDIMMLIKFLKNSNISVQKLDIISQAFECAKMIKENENNDVIDIIDKIYKFSGGNIETPKKKIEETPKNYADIIIESTELPSVDDFKPVEKSFTKMTEDERIDYIMTYTGDIKYLLAKLKFNINTLKTNYNRDKLKNFKSFPCKNSTNCQYNDKCLFEHYPFKNKEFIKNKVCGLQGIVINEHWDNLIAYINN